MCALTECTGAVLLYLVWWWLNEPKHVAEILILITNMCCVYWLNKLLYCRHICLRVSLHWLIISTFLRSRTSLWGYLTCNMTTSVECEFFMNTWPNSVAYVPNNVWEKTVSIPGYLGYVKGKCVLICCHMLCWFIV